MTFYSMTLYVYHMNMEMSITKENIWEEKNLTEREKNCFNNNAIELKNIITDTKNDLTKKVCVDIGKISGIYKIINKINGLYLVGSSKNLNGRDCRWKQHKKDARKNKHCNPKFQNAWNKYGENCFEFVIVEKVEPIEKLLLETEQKYLDIAKMEKDKCYNLCFIVNRGPEWTDEMKEKISNFHKNRIKSSLECQHISESKRGKPAHNKGHPISDEQRQKLSKINMGKKLSEEVKKKISMANKGRIVSEETKKKLRNANKGQVPWSKGKKLSDENRKNKSIGAKKRWEKYRQNKLLNSVYNFD